jgi:hypothetical protein
MAMRRLLMISVSALLFGCGDKPDVAQLVGDLTFTTFTAIIEEGLGTMTDTASCPGGGTIHVDLMNPTPQGRFPLTYAACADRGYIYDGEIASSIGSNGDVYTLKYSGAISVAGKVASELEFTDLEEVVSFEGPGMTSFTMKLTGEVDVTEEGDDFHFEFAARMFKYDKDSHAVSEM